MEKLDNIHINFRQIFGYQKPFNAIISCREAGKSTEWVKYAYNTFKEGRTNLILRRQIVDITDAYITSIQEVINKFFDEKLVFKYNKGSMKDGIVYLYVEDQLFGVLLALSVSIARIKSLVLRNIKYIWFDEFIINPRFKEKFLPQEADKFKEIYNTFYRESKDKITCVWMGNPYTHYNPYFTWWGVDTSKIHPDTIQCGSNWVVWCYEITEELKQSILKRNPLYEFDDSYKRYGFGGQAVCDENIKIGDFPKDYTLRFVFRIDGKFVGVYRNNYLEDMEDRYYCQIIENFASDRIAYCFDFNELVNRCALVSSSDRIKFSHFKTAFRNRKVSFSKIEVYYLIEEIFNNL